jgi:Transposase
MGRKGFAMKKRHSAEQIVGLLRQADVALGKGEKVPEVCKQFGISEQTYYRWRTKYGGMDPQMAETFLPRPSPSAFFSVVTLLEITGSVAPPARAAGGFLNIRALNTLAGDHFSVAVYISITRLATFQTSISAAVNELMHCTNMGERFSHLSLRSHSAIQGCRLDASYDVAGTACPHCAQIAASRKGATDFSRHHATDAPNQRRTNSRRSEIK